MLSSLLVCFMLAALAGSDESQTVEVKRFQSIEPVANGSFNYSYYDEKAKEAAEKVIKIWSDTEFKRNEYLNDTKDSNIARNKLKDYEELVKSVNGTKCEVAEEDRNKYCGAEKRINETVDDCDRNAPKEDFEYLRGNITEILTKIQRIDSEIRYMLCFISLRLDLPKDNCEYRKEKLREEIERLVSKEEIDRLNSLEEKALDKYKENLKVCVNDSNEDLIKMLNDSMEYINKCKAECGY